MTGLFAQVQKPSSDISWRKRISMADEFVQKNDHASAAVFCKGKGKAHPTYVRYFI